MKKQKGTVDATPSKRLFLSIIADYDVNRSSMDRFFDSSGIKDKIRGIEWRVRGIGIGFSYRN